VRAVSAKGTAAPLMPQVVLQTQSPESPLEEFVAVTKAAGDRLRANILRVLHSDSFGVLELCAIFDTAQPALSHHLKVLHQAGLVARHREGNSIFYRRRVHVDESPIRSTLHANLFSTIDELPIPGEIATRLEATYRQRRTSSEAFFASNANALASQQTLISPSSAYAESMVAAWRHTDTERGEALEIGPGDGELLASLARDFDRVHGIDSSLAMLAAPERRCEGLGNVRLENREFEQLPAHPHYDLLVTAMVVHHMPSPARFFTHAHALLNSGGLLLIAELVQHDQEWVRDACGDLWLGFDTSTLLRWAIDAGFEPREPEFLAQKNGFRIQTLSFLKPQLSDSGEDT